MASTVPVNNRRISICFGSRMFWSDQELIKVAQAAENLGYEAIFIAESWGRDVFTLLTLLALNTKRIKLGTGIASIWARSPTMTAQTAASLDSMSNGRFILGLGTGNPAVVQDWHGQEFKRPLRRTREYADVVRMVLNGQRLDYQGQIFKFGGTFEPVYKGPRNHIPMYIAAIGPKLIELAGEIADGWVPVYAVIPKFHVLKRHLDLGAQRVGRNPSDIDIALSIVTCIDDDEEWGRLQFRERMALRIGGMGDRYHNLMCRFDLKEHADRIRAAWTEGDHKAATALVTDEMVDQMTIVGKPELCRQRLEACYTAGITMPILSFLDHLPLKVVYRSLEALAPLATQA